jgi:hypothetical protein
MRRYHHIGIPTTEPKPRISTGQVSGFGGSASLGNWRGSRPEALWGLASLWCRSENIQGAATPNEAEYLRRAKQTVWNYSFHGTLYLHAPRLLRAGYLEWLMWSGSRRENIPVTVVSRTQADGRFGQLPRF